MIFNTIMVQLDVDSPATPRLTFARHIASRFEAELIAFAAAQVHVFAPRSESSMVTSEVMRKRAEEIEERLKTLKEEFLALTGDNGHVSWRGEIGNPTHLLAIHGRAADLIVTGAPAPGVAIDHHRIVDPGPLILSAGRPVLFAADDLAPLSARKVVVAWKDAREARRAVVDAMPFLTIAREVVVATLAEGDVKAVRESAADVVRFLIRHGVKARFEMPDVGQGKGAEVLTDMARSIGADLVVAGGYGHSRVREWAFGGMTRSLLDDGSLNRLLSN